MDLSKFNKINRKQDSFEFKDENSGYEAKGMRQQVSGGGFGISFNMSSEIVTESDPTGFFPLLGKTFDEILSLGSGSKTEEKEKKLSRKERKALENRKALTAKEQENSENKSLLESIYDFWF